MEFYLILFFVAVVYASVGHGGASGYLALMAIYGFAPEIMKPTALILNLFVAGISFLQYWRKGFFNIRLFLPFAIASVPAAFLGGMLQLEATLYKQVLGILLLFAVLRMLGLLGQTRERSLKWLLALFIGAGIGFFSGLIGIGGGIILSPVILLLGWGNIKETAAVSALFIWINSLAGLSGFYLTGFSTPPELIWYIMVAFTGGLVGGYIGSYRWNNTILRFALSSVLLLASVKLIFF